MTDIDSRTLAIWKAVWESTQGETLKDGEMTERMLGDLFNTGRTATRNRIEKMLQAGKITRREASFGGRRCYIYSVVEKDCSCANGDKQPCDKNCKCDPKDLAD